MLLSIALGLKPRAIASNFWNWLYKPYHEFLSALGGRTPAIGIFFNIFRSSHRDLLFSSSASNFLPVSWLRIPWEEPQ